MTLLSLAYNFCSLFWDQFCFLLFTHLWLSLFTLLDNDFLKLISVSLILSQSGRGLQSDSLSSLWKQCLYLRSFVKTVGFLLAWFAFIFSQIVYYISDRSRHMETRLDYNPNKEKVEILSFVQVRKVRSSLGSKKYEIWILISLWDIPLVWKVKMCSFISSHREDLGEDIQKPLGQQVQKHALSPGSW